MGRRCADTGQMRHHLHAPVFAFRAYARVEAHQSHESFCGLGFLFVVLWLLLFYSFLRSKLQLHTDLGRVVVNAIGYTC